MSFSHASVVETVGLTDRLQRIVLDVDDPAALDIRIAGDSAVGVYFPTDAADPAPQGRNYSVRYHDGPRITLDVVLHAHGPGSEWASSTLPGDRVGLDHARSWYRPEPETTWQLLVTDLSGLPATARILEELSGGAEVILVAEVPDAAHLDYLPRHPGVTVVPRTGTGNGCGASVLARTVREISLPEGRGYCWFAGEAAQ